MAGNVTGFQRTFVFKQNDTYKEVGMQQAVVYSDTAKEVEVPEQDNLKPVGAVTYQWEENDGRAVAVQLNRIAELEADGNIKFGEDVIVSAGGKVKSATSVATGTVVNVLGEAHASAANGEVVQIEITKKTYKA